MYLSARETLDIRASDYGSRPAPAGDRRIQPALY